MSFRAKLDDLLKSKKDKEEWYCYMVPEEYHFWTARNHWQPIENYHVKPIVISVTGKSSTNTSIPVRYTRRKPKKLNCGCEATGHHTMSQSRTVGFTIRVDSTVEINDALTEIAKEYLIDTFDIIRLDVLNKQNIILQCYKHNPDSQGTSFYISRFIVDGKEELYPNVLLSKMKEYVGDFKNKVAQCYWVPKRDKGCVIKDDVKEKRTQVRLRKK